MIAIALKTFLGKYFWQIPLVLALVVGVARWDYKRIERHVDKGKTEVRVEIRQANDKAVETADRVRAKSQSGSVRAVPKDLDPYSSN